MNIVKKLIPIADNAGAVLRDMAVSDLDGHNKAHGELVTRADQISLEILSQELATQIECGTWLNGKKIRLKPDQSMANGVVGVENNGFQTDEERSWTCRLASSSLAI